MEKNKFNLHVRSSISKAIEQAKTDGERNDLFEVLEQFDSETEPQDAVTDKELARTIREVALEVARDVHDICIMSDSLVTDNGNSGYWVECSVYVPYPEEE